MTRALSAHAVAIAAGVSQTWAWKARDSGIIHAPHSEDDVIALRVYVCVSQLAWPGERRARSEKHELQLWQTLAVNAARDAVSDRTTTQDTVLWVMPDAVRVVTTPGERAAFELDTLGGRTAMRIPIGKWIAELDGTLDGIPTPRPRRTPASPSRPSRTPAEAAH
ncbi:MULTISPECIES: hypothetical protein [Streptacidiphilus]|uniref:Uncharacterized protein n=1 Tax=Streptacidiphilus cavernicola TaxID=3342716 RepID=A0ABV6UW98_9ACTN|nr:hypothetical protein [Streptacidiphilus jeojiense]